LRITGVSTFYGTILHYPMTISPDGTLLIAVEGNDRSRVAPRITSFDSTTGAIVKTYSTGDWTPSAPPLTVSSLRACALARGVNVVRVLQRLTRSLFHHLAPGRAGEPRPG
jgi:hypothetical protein